MNSAASPMLRFAEVLLKGGDSELALLKAHLLIEEALTAIICSTAEQPKYIEELRLAFPQKVSLARGFCAIESEAWVWDALQLLNNARNELGHRLSSADVQRKVDDFVRFVEAKRGAPHASLLGGTFSPFHWAAARVFTVLASKSKLGLGDMSGNADAIGGIEG